MLVTINTENKPLNHICALDYVMLKFLLIGLAYIENSNSLIC